MSMLETYLFDDSWWRHCYMNIVRMEICRPIRLNAYKQLVKSSYIFFRYGAYFRNVRSMLLFFEALCTGKKHILFL